MAGRPQFAMAASRVPGRPFAWLDDEIGEADRRWISDHHTGPALLHRVDPRIGLLLVDFAALEAWATTAAHQPWDAR